jgi:Phosphoenolpyruvate carboxylase
MPAIDSLSAMLAAHKSHNRVVRRRTDEIRRRKPTPLDEMLSGLAYLTAIFDTVPRYARAVDAALLALGQPRLPLGRSILSFGSWMGGDRDGNPNVKPHTTRDVVISSRLAACDLYMKLVGVRCSPGFAMRRAFASMLMFPWHAVGMSPVIAWARQHASSATLTHAGVTSARSSRKKAEFASFRQQHPSTLADNTQRFAAAHVRALHLALLTRAQGEVPGHLGGGEAAQRRGHR